MKKQKLIGAVLGIVLFIVLIAGVTYAAISWNSDNINLNVKSECFDVLYDKGTDLTGAIIPSEDYTGGNYVAVKMDINSRCDVNANGKIYLVTSSSTSSNLYSEGLLNYQVLLNGEVTDIKGNIISSGEIEIDVGLLNKNSTATTTYTVYVWIDKELVTNEHVSSVYSGYIYSKAIQASND